MSREVIRAVHPRSHPTYARGFANFSDEDLAGSLYIAMRATESVLIAKAFAAALGKPDPHPDTSRKSLVASLTDDYRLFGVSSGPKHTEQLVRRLEKAVIAQAHEHLRPGRS